ncbi:hypothetical protein [Sphingomonas sp. IW22]|uniref:hypothetical protein n=1 Tax=Sphingomonas sp. IW22 TaxID=3242489 RepID=UPI003521E93B
MADAPIEARYRATLNALAGGIDTVLNGKDRDGSLVFVLFVAEAGRIEGGRVNYISNGHRADMIAMVREWLLRAEGAVGGEGGRA